MSEQADAEEKAAPDAPVVADAVVEGPPPEPAANFPKITRQFFDVLYDDERSEVWIGMRLRQTMKGRKMLPNGQPGPIEDVEVNADAVGVIVGLDAAKQEVLIALNKDAQALNQKRARQEALKGNGILDRLTAGLGRAVNAGKSLIH